MDDGMITSASNPLVKRIRLLGEAKQRRAEGAFVVEGIRPVWQAVQSGAVVETLIVAPDLLSSAAAVAMLEAQRRAGRRVARVSRALFERIALREHPSGLAAIVAMPRLSLEALPVLPQGVYVALLQAGNPGNLGTIVRTVDAVGGAGLIVVGEATDPYHPTAVKASMGTLFTVPIVQVEAWHAVLRWCGAHAIGVVTTAAHAPVPYWSASYTLPALLLFGSEGMGLPDAVLAAGSQAVHIPMYGSADSLNLAVSVGVLLYELRRRQLAAGDPPMASHP